MDIDDIGQGTSGAHGAYLHVMAFSMQGMQLYFLHYCQKHHLKERTCI